MRLAVLLFAIAHSASAQSARIEGTATDDAGRPVWATPRSLGPGDGVLVFDERGRVQRFVDDTGDGTRPYGNVTKDGFWVARDLKPGTYELRFGVVRTPPAKEPLQVLRVFGVRAGGTTRLDVRVPTGTGFATQGDPRVPGDEAWLEGTFRDQAGQPLYATPRSLGPGEGVRLIDAAGKSVKLIDVTGEDVRPYGNIHKSGFFLARGLKPGTYELRLNAVTPKGERTRTVRVKQLTLEGGRVTRVAFDTTKGAGITELGADAGLASSAATAADAALAPGGPSSAIVQPPSGPPGGSNAALNTVPYVPPPMEGVCSGPGKGRAYTPCTDDSQCCSNNCQVCTCQPFPKLGDSCMHLQTCEFGWCQDGRCQCLRDGQKCESPGMPDPRCCSVFCGQDGRCDVNAVHPAGAPCTSDEWCKYGKCENGRCTSVACKR